MAEEEVRPDGGILGSGCLPPYGPEVNQIEVNPRLCAVLISQGGLQSLMTYWLDLFSGTSWREFRAAGERISGFRLSTRRNAGQIKKGDVFLCYLTGVMRWVGALEVVGLSQDKTRIWTDDEYPIRFEVKPLLVLDPEHGVPMEHLVGKVDFFRGPDDGGKFRGFVRSSLNRFKKDDDARLILSLLEQAKTAPVARPVDARKLARKPFFTVEAQRGKAKAPVVVSVPEREDTSPGATPEVEAVSRPEVVSASRHTEIQFLLLQLGSELGLDVWVARNDRSRSWNGLQFERLPGLVRELPTQFNDATNRTIELIDVLWLKGNSIVAAFEIESTTSVYSGLLRMSDLLALQPNLDIKLFLVAPDDRKAKVEQELLRPTFSLRDRPLHKTCGFLSFSILVETVEALRKCEFRKFWHAFSGKFGTFG